LWVPYRQQHCQHSTWRRRWWTSCCAPGRYYYMLWMFARASRDSTPHTSEWSHVLSCADPDGCKACDCNTRPSFFSWSSHRAGWSVRTDILNQELPIMKPCIFVVTHRTDYFIHVLDFKREKMEKMSFLPLSSSSGRSLIICHNTPPPPPIHRLLLLGLFTDYLP